MRFWSVVRLFPSHETSACKQTHMAASSDASGKRGRDARDDAPFRPTAAADAAALTDAARLCNGVLMPWVGFGTYKLGASSARKATLDAIRCGYRMIDTA